MSVVEADTTIIEHLDFEPSCIGLGCENTPAWKYGCVGCDSGGPICDSCKGRWIDFESALGEEHFCLVCNLGGIPTAFLWVVPLP